MTARSYVSFKLCPNDRFLQSPPSSTLTWRNRNVKKGRDGRRRERAIVRQVVVLKGWWLYGARRGVY